MQRPVVGSVSPFRTIPGGQKQPSTQEKVPHWDWGPCWRWGQEGEQAGPQGSYTSPSSHCSAAHRRRAGSGRYASDANANPDPNPNPEGGGTYGRAPGSASGCRPLCGCTPQRRQRRLCTDTRSRPRSRTFNTQVMRSWGASPGARGAARPASGLRHSPTGVKDAPLVVLLEGHLQVTPGEQLLGQDRTPLPGPSHSVGIQLDTNAVVL